MPDTLLSEIIEISRATGQNPSISAFSDSNDSNWMVDKYNEALQNLYNLKPFEIDTNGTITVTPSTRTFSVPSGLDAYRVYEWSWRLDDADGDIPLEFVTKESIVTGFPKFETHEGERPQYVYFDNNLIGVYPLLQAGAANLTIQFIYPGMFSKLTAVGATFPFPDRSDELLYCRKYVQFKYENWKGLGQPGDTEKDLFDLWSRLVAKYAKKKKVRLRGYRVYP